MSWATTKRLQREGARRTFGPANRTTCISYACYLEWLWNANCRTPSPVDSGSYCGLKLIFNAADSLTAVSRECP